MRLSGRDVQPDVKVSPGTVRPIRLRAGGLMFGWLRWRGTPLPSRSEWAGAARIGFLLLVGVLAGADGVVDGVA